jgi:hypothetical protein
MVIDAAASSDKSGWNTYVLCDDQTEAERVAEEVRRRKPDAEVVVEHDHHGWYVWIVRPFYSDDYSYAAI